MNKNFKNLKISFIGGGNMAGSIVGGLIADGWPNANIIISDPSEERREILQNSFRVNCVENNEECAALGGIVVLAVKPQIMKQAINSIGPILRKNYPLLISIAAGIRISDIVNWAEKDLPIIRVMPNTPALVNCGASALLAGSKTKKDHKIISELIMKAVGEVIWVNSEKDIDTVTGISGSGPAYYFKLMEIMMGSAKSHGLNSESARTLVLQTALGAAKLAIASDQEPSELRRHVTSPGGTTEAALLAMEKNGIDEIIANGIDAAIVKSDELAKTLGES